MISLLRLYIKRASWRPIVSKYCYKQHFLQWHRPIWMRKMSRTKGAFAPPPLSLGPLSEGRRQASKWQRVHVSRVTLLFSSEPELNLLHRLLTCKLVYYMLPSAKTGVIQSHLFKADTFKESVLRRITLLPSTNTPAHIRAEQRH